MNTAIADVLKTCGHRFMRTSPRQIESASVLSAACQSASEKEAQGAYGHRKNDENDPQCKGEAQFALARLQGDGRRHCAGIAADIAANDDDRADFSNGPAEGRKEGRQQSVPADEHDLAYGS